MSTNSNKKCYNLKYELQVEDWQKPCLEKMFKTWNTIYNQMFSYTCRLLHEAKQNKDFAQNLNFAKNYTITLDNKEIQIFKPGTHSNFVNNIYKNFARNYDGKEGRMFCSYVNSKIVAFLAKNIDSGIEKYFKSSRTKSIHRKKQIDCVMCPRKERYPNVFYPFKLIFEGKKTVLEISYRKKDTINIPLTISDKDSLKMYSFVNPMKQLGLKREMIRGKYKYYVIICFEGDKPINQTHQLGQGNVGIDPSQQCMHYVTDSEVNTIAIGDKDAIEKYSRQIIIIQRKLERSRRQTNPDNFNEDGTIKKGNKKLIWVKSKNYIKLQNKLANLQRKLADKRKKYQYEVANQLVQKGNVFKIEKNSYDSFSKRAQGVRKNKNGKILSNRRFGKSIGNYAPSQFIDILKQKINERNGTVIEVPSQASSTQFDFTNQTFTKHELSERTITLSNGNTHNRDYVAAFNIQHYIGNNKEKSASNFDVDKMKEDYANFCFITS